MNDRPTDKQSSSGSSPDSLPDNAAVTLPLTKKDPQTKSWNRLRRRVRHRFLSLHWRQMLPAVGLAIGSAVLTAWNPIFLQRADRSIQDILHQAQALQFPVVPPEEIVIVAIDDDSLNQFKQAPPLKRRIYAQVIDRLMKAGAKAIALDLLFDLPSGNNSSGNNSNANNLRQNNPSPDSLETTDCEAIKPEQLSEDDRLLQSAIVKYRDRIVLAAQYDEIRNENWIQTQLTLPYCPFQAAQIGTINFPIAPDHKIHQFGNQFTPFNVQANIQSDAQLNTQSNDSPEIPLVDALIKRAGLPLSEAKPQDIPFLGFPGQSFQAQTVPLWYILFDENWNSDRLQKGAFFKNKIILIGATATSMGGLLETPVGQMSGVELQATALAARLRHRQIRNLFPQPWQNAVLIVGLIGLSTTILLHGDRKKQRSIGHIPAWFLLINLGWLSLGYASLVILSAHLPLAAPSISLVLATLLYPLQRLGGDRKTQQQLRSTLKRYGNSPLIQEIIEQQDDPNLRNLLTERQEELQGKKLGGRYEITEILDSGGFAETYTAKDIQLPGTPICVVKHLRPRSDSLSHLALARRLFDQEARTLQELGQHDRIPQLLAFFEEDQEFYLIQQFIPGKPLSQTLTLGRQLPEAHVVGILAEILDLLDFVHHHQVIHRDIKPSNIIQRSNDQHLVLIDFGAVKALEHLPAPDQPSDLTVAIGTQGYMAPEQQLGNPRPSSDLYSLGILAIQALTGLPARQFIPNPETHTINWESRVTSVSRPLRTIVNRLTAYNYRDRYQSATETLTDLQVLIPDRSILPRLLSELPNTSELPNSDDGSNDPQNARQNDQRNDLNGPTKLWIPHASTLPSGMPITEKPPTDPLS